MRCARHPYEAAGGGGGVCAPCLRGRLLALAAAQNAASTLPPPPPEHEEPEPAAFPRSASPYVSRRKSDASASAPPRGRPPGSLLFFRTPQVGPAYGGGSGSGAAGFEDGDIGLFRSRRSGRGRFSVLAAIFGQRSSEEDKERRYRPSSSSSWLAGIVPGARWRRRKKDRETTGLPPPPSPPRRSCRGGRGVSDRGLSPVRYAADGDGDGEEESTSSAAESPWWLPSPSPMRKTPCRRRLGLGATGGGGVSGFSVCISPLVRPSLGRHLRGGHPPDAVVVSGDLRPSPLHPLTSSASLHHCRSWKLADGGRFR